LQYLKGFGVTAWDYAASYPYDNRQFPLANTLYTFLSFNIDHIAF